MNSPVASETLRLALAASLTVVAAAGAQSPPSDSRRGDSTHGPDAARAVAYYDTSLRRVVLVGGAMQPRFGARDRVWSWSGARWAVVTDSGPTARGNAGAAYDARRRVAVVTGGARRAANDSTFEIVAETWTGSANGWRPFRGADVTPRDHQSMVYDESRHGVLMFGGILADRSEPWPADTWEMTDGGWARIATDGPPGRGRSALVYDTRRRQVVLFGGVGAPPSPRQPQPFFNDTWVFDSAGWRKVAEGGPRGRYAHGMVFDERAGVVLLYSGAAAHRDAPLEDMWQWDGTRWTEIRLTGPTPGFRYQPVMVYDRARGVTVLYGGLQGSTNDTWEWDGRRWTNVSPR